VTPSLNPATIEIAKRYSKVITPGALTPTEVVAAWQAGGDIIKVFPCSAVGGAKYIKALRAPFPQIEMIPTGGVNLETVGDFLKAGACAVAVGGELIDGASIRAGHFELFEERAKRFLEVIKKTREQMSAA
jgi:2-dehydro-3-deoxyphosphogluconate aldolase/(4S)-4-hydroxy-2-oxoglutarate aldolase